MRSASDWVDEFYIAAGDKPLSAFVVRIQREAMEAMREAAAKEAEQTETADVVIKGVLYDDAEQTLKDAAKAIRAIDVESLLGGGA